MRRTSSSIASSWKKRPWLHDALQNSRYVGDATTGVSGCSTLCACSGHAVHPTHMTPTRRTCCCPHCNGQARPVHTGGPFVVHDSNAPLTVPIEPHFATDTRVVERSMFDAHVAERMRIEEVWRVHHCCASFSCLLAFLLAWLLGWSTLHSPRCTRGFVACKSTACGGIAPRRRSAAVRRRPSARLRRRQRASTARSCASRCDA